AGGHVVPGLVLVVVVAEVQHQVRVLLGEVPVGGEVAVLVLGAGGERHGQRHHRGGGRGGAGAADRGEGAGGPEPVEVLPVRLQPAQLDVHAVAQLRDGLGLPALHDAFEALVL